MVNHIGQHGKNQIAGRGRSQALEGNANTHNHQVAAAQTGHAKAVCLERRRSVDAACSVIHAAHSGIVELSGLAVVDIHTVHIHIAIAAVIGAVLESCRAPQVSYVARIDVAV